MTMRKPLSVPGPASLARRRRLAMLAWRALALCCLGLAAVGVVLPGLPTVPFLLLAAWAASHGWSRLEAWLLAHPRCGPPIRRWRERGAVPRRAKWASSIMMGLSATMIALSSVPLWLKLALPALMLAVAVWLWRRPDS
jgi:uncharacterized membrane protein YbaN (DUF454 family)